ncbi:MAG: ubiquinone/menaquinone biosynthesis methyltransferase [Candidatus Brocadiae bacterium]|nr:ubiquinone/menaquinone biosynthesis methyltransferase [Candidatus Brocadiia bacterium]
MSDPLSKAPEKIAGMFDRIGPSYDRMNGVMTFGRHGAWRRAAAREVARDLAGGGRALDACTGTADLALSIRREVPGATVVGTDFSQGMLTVGRAKTAGDPRIRLARADTLRLPFADAAFRSATVGWGIRNVADVSAALRELLRILAPAGRLHVLESARPAGWFGRLGFRLYFRGVVPWLGRLLARNAADAYNYLPKSAEAFAPAEEFAGLMRGSGFADVSWRSFAFGGVTLHSGTRPP